MHPVDILVNEHTLIHQFLAGLAYALKKLEREDLPVPTYFEEFVLFARGFVDDYHHGKEEDHMFALLATKVDSAFGPPIESLRLQHESGRKYVEAIASAIEGYAANQEDKVSLITENLAAYISMLRQHIHREDHIFFPMSKKELTETEQLELMQEFEKADQEAGSDYLQESRERILRMEALLSLV